MGACISHTWPWSQPFPSRSIYRTPPSVRRTNQNRAIRSMSRRVPENSASSSGKSKEEYLANQKTSCDGGKRRRPA